MSVSGGHIVVGIERRVALMSEPRPPKKTEFLEIRVPHATKLAFMARCRTNEQTASDALRGFIDRYLEEAIVAPQAPVSPGRRPRRPALHVMVGALIASAVGAAALPTLAHTTLRAEFGRTDSNDHRRIGLDDLGKAASIDIDIKLKSSPPKSPGAADRETGPPADALRRELALRAQFERLDTNKDGEISFEEFRHGCDPRQPSARGCL
jgi:hypothetical protein